MGKATLSLFQSFGDLGPVDGERIVCRENDQLHQLHQHAHHERAADRERQCNACPRDGDFGNFGDARGGVGRGEPEVVDDGVTRSAPARIEVNVVASEVR